MVFTMVGAGWLTGKVVCGGWCTELGCDDVLPRNSEEERRGESQQGRVGAGWCASRDGPAQVEHSAWNRGKTTVSEKTQY